MVSEVKSNTIPTLFKNKRVVIAVVAAVIIAVVGTIGVRALIRSNRYENAMELYEAREYEEAREEFASLQGYKEADSYATDCVYHIGLDAMKGKNYSLACEIFEELDEYKLSKGYLRASQLGMKYELFSGEYKGPELIDDSMLADKDDVERRMEQYVYGTWYDSESGEELPVDALHLNGKRYGVKAARGFDDYLVVLCYYLDTPEEVFTICTGSEFFDYISQSVRSLSLVSDDPETEMEIYAMYYDVTPERYQELWALEEEEMAKIPNYSDEEIIEKTFSAFKKDIRSYYSGPDTLYHGSDYSDAYVVYDYETQTYTCTMTAEYSTNIFDIWGTSTQTYFVTAEFRDTGAGLTMTGYIAY